MPTQTPCLWFDGQAEQAARHYTAIFPNSEILGTTRYGPGTPGPEGEVMTVDFSLDGQRYVGLNGGPQFAFTEAVSFQIDCADQDEVDHYWTRLADGGEEGPCGWLKDRFGLSWQIVPERFNEILRTAEPEAAQRAVKAMLGMGKLDIAELEAAAAG
jgi:predicted 3-demethylubiquinone-9 3-methyltransferase (glyoxalase superfamily)